MNYRIKFHITYVKYAETLIWHLKVPYIVYAWNGNEELKDSDSKTFSITEEKPQGEEYIDLYWNTIDDENYDQDGKITDAFFRFATKFTIGIGPADTDDMPGPYTIKQLWKEGAKSFNYTISGDTKIECTISLDNVGPRRLVKSDYNFGSDPNHMTDLYNIIETDTQLAKRKELTDFTISNSQNPIQYIPYENNEQYIFSTQVDWNGYQYKNALQKKEGSANKSFFLDYKPLPINMVPDYIYDFYSQPKDWGYFADSTSNDNKYSYKIWKNGTNIYILKGTWSSYSTAPTQWYNPDHPSSSNPKQITCNYSNIILDLQAAGGKGGNGDSNAWSYQPTNTGACGGGGGGFVRCLIDIDQYTQSQPLQITLTPQAQNTDFYASSLPYSYIELKEGSIKCYNGQPGHNQQRTVWACDAGYNDRNYWNPGGIGGGITYSLNNSNKKILNTMTNQKSSWYSGSSNNNTNKYWIKIELKNFQWSDIWLAYTPSGRGLTSNETIYPPLTYSTSSDAYTYYNNSHEHEITITYKDHSITLPPAYLGPDGRSWTFSCVKINPNSWVQTKLENCDYTSLTNEENNITFLVYYNNPYYTKMIFDQNSVQDSLKSVDIWAYDETPYSTNIGSLYYNITNANKEIFNNNDRINMTCKVLSSIPGNCGGNNNYDHTMSDGDQVNNDNPFSWKQNEIQLPFEGIIHWGKGGVGCLGKRENTIASITRYYLGGAGGGGSAMGCGYNGYNIHNITNDSGFPNPLSFQTDTNYWGGGGGGGCYFYESVSWHHYVNGSKGQPAGFIIHW